MTTKVIPLIIATAIGAAIAGVVVHTTQNRQHSNELAKLEKRFSTSPLEAKQISSIREPKTIQPHHFKQNGESSPNETTQPDLLQPTDIIESLLELKADDKRTMRRAVHYLETLVDQGDRSLPAIADFLEEDSDLDFTTPRSAQANFDSKEKLKKRDKPKGKDKPKDKDADEKKDPKSDTKRDMAWNYFRPYPRTDRAFPATLRLGLLEVTAFIGSEEAEKLLLRELDATARGVEVAYLEIALQDMAPGKHLKKILEVTRELLEKLPPVPAGEFSVDRQAKGYLYSILVKYKDLVFVKIAERLLVNPDGSLDGYALSYLRQVLGADAIPILQRAIDDNRITDGVAKYAVRDAALHYVGQSAQADQILMQTVREGLESQGEGREFKWGAFKVSNSALIRDLHNQPDETLMNRRQLIQNIREEFNHPTLNQGLNKMDGILEHTLRERRENEK